MTNPTPHGQVPAIQRYKIGYHSDEWGVRSLSPTGIYDDAGPWVRYEDHAAELRRLHARIAELEAQIESIGAGGVGPLVRADGFTAADMATAAAEGFRASAAEVAKFKGQRLVLCSLLRECLPVIDALMHTPQSDYSDEYLNRLLSRAGDALKAIAEEQVKGGES